MTDSTFTKRRGATTKDAYQPKVWSSKAQNAMDQLTGVCMRTDKLMMINTDPETIAAFKRALAFKVAAALTVVFTIAVIAVTAPDSASSDASTTPAVVQPVKESSRSEADLGRGSDITDPATPGVDMHG
ncbi:MAG: hypothetical protein ACXW16_00035 [Burkholderiaceae bacterium]